MDILHIYAITSGSAGSYMDKIYNTLNKQFSQEVIVNYYYPYNYGKKVFYKFSDLSCPNIIHKINKLRLIVRYFEMLIGLIYTVFFIFFKKPKIINYSLTSQINIEYLFLLIIKKYSKSKLYLTIHDVLPFKTSYTNQENDIKKRKSFFILADKLIVHNQNSIDDLINYYQIDNSKIIYHIFPIMDISNMNFIEDKDKSIDKYFNEKDFIFSFVGHLRIEKGIDTLLDAWNLFKQNRDSKNCKLLIAGNIPKGFNYDFSNQLDIILINKFLSDSEYKKVIEFSDCIILPYTMGTNSGIPSTVLSLGTSLITSDIKMFMNIDFIDKKYIFENKNPNALSLVMDKMIKKRDYDFSKIQNYDLSFKQTILELYKKELSHV